MLALILVWPLGVLMLFIAYGGREYTVSKIASGTCEISTFSLSWASIIFSFFFFGYILIHGITMAVTFLISEKDCNWNGSYGFLPNVGLGLTGIFSISLVIGADMLVCITTKIPDQAFPVPNYVFILLNYGTFKCFNDNTVKRLAVKLSVCSVILAFLAFSGFHLPIVLLAILAAPYRIAFLFLSMVLFAISIVALIAAVMSIDQVFVSDYRVAITGKIGCKQCLSWLYTFKLSLFGLAF